MATKTYFGESITTTRKRKKTTRAARSKTKTTRKTKRKYTRSGNNTIVMIPVPAKLAFEFGFTLGQATNN